MSLMEEVMSGPTTADILEGAHEVCDAFTAAVERLLVKDGQYMPAAAVRLLAVVAAEELTAMRRDALMHRSGASLRERRQEQEELLAAFCREVTDMVRKCERLDRDARVDAAVTRGGS